MKKIISLSIAAAMAMAIPTGASAAKISKIDFNNTKLLTNICVAEKFGSVCTNLPGFKPEAIYPGFNINLDQDCNGNQNNNTPDVNLPEQDDSNPGTNTPEQDNSQNGGNQDTIVPPAEPDTDAPDNNDTPNIEPSLNEYEREVISIVNRIRTENGLGELAADEELSRVARIKSQDMKNNNYFSHTSPTYGSPFDMMQQFGITYRSAGENIAKGQSTPQAVVNAWMNSEGHRANILNPSFTAIGVGYVSGGNYWTQMFVGR